MIVGTAGHIDHGKTTLVRALTGVDTDRLPEEKARGISIELGYAFLGVPGGDARIGFIDVPGHERLVHTMLAGATGIDHALLLVAADDGPMPQTHEHLAVLSLLGIASGAVVITKADRADAAQLAQVSNEVAALVAGTPFEGAPVFVVSATDGRGVDALREHLFDAARRRRRREDAGAAFRLAVDRTFTLSGIGTVVTGTVHAGRVRVGDALSLTPSTIDTPLRVRSLHAQNQPVDEARAGQRCAIALAGVSKENISRGQWLVAPEVALATDRIDAQLTLWPAEARALRSGTPVHVHVGASDTLGSVAVLQLIDPDEVAETLPPGRTARVQLVLRTPIGAWHGDRVVLRDASASRTIAGGFVLDPFAPARYRRTPQRLALLAAQTLPTAAERLQGLVEIADEGVERARWQRAEGLVAMPQFDPARQLGDTLFGAARHAALNDATLAALQAFHTQQPDMLGPDAARLRRLAAPRLAEAPWQALLAQLQHDARIAVRGAFVHLPAHGLRLSATDERLAQKIAPQLAAAGFEGRWVRDLARDCGEGEALMRTTLARLAQRGDLHQLVKDLYYPPAAIAQLAALARTVADERDEEAGAAGAVTAARFRDASGLGRKRAIQVLEYFDRIGLLRRVGDEHRLRRDSLLFRTHAFGEMPATH